MMKRRNSKKTAVSKRHLGSEAKQGKHPKRDLSQINFKSQHWWGDGQIFKPYKKDGKIQRKMPVDEAKAALIYEAMRRRPEVQEIWMKGNFDPRTNGWQDFVGMTAQHLLSSWEMLDEMTKKTFVMIMQSPWFVPPLGYSTYPDKSTPDKCEEVATKLLRLPQSNDPTDATGFVEYARRFEGAGFIFLAIDHKTRQSDAYALRALKKLLAKLPHTFRKQDHRTVINFHLPPDISAEDRQGYEEKKQQGILTRKAFNDLWEKYHKPIHIENPCGLDKEWAKPATVHEQPGGKRSRKSKSRVELVEEMRFDLPKLFAELADLDHGKIQNSDFVRRLRP